MSPTRAKLASLRHWFRERLDGIDRHDALGLITTHTRTPWGLGVFILICTFPMLGHVVSRLIHGRPWFNDYEAVLCAAHEISQGRSPYSLTPECAGMHPAPYVYAPQIAQVLAPLTRFFDPSELRLGYAVLLVPMMLMSLVLVLRMPAGSGFRRLSLLSLTAMSGGAISCGNVGFVLLGLILLGALCLERTPWPFALALLVAVPVKPIYLAFVLVLLYRQGPIRNRLGSTAALGFAALLLIGAVWMTAGPLYEPWQQNLRAIALQQQPGIGFFALADALGLKSTDPLVLVSFGLYALSLIIGGFYVAERARLSRDTRLLLSLGIALLINPRLMDYDMLPLGPFMAMLLLKVRDDLGAAVFSRLSWAYAAPLGLCFIANLLEIRALHRAPFAVLDFSLITLTILGLYLAREPAVQRLRLIPIRPQRPVDLKARP